MKAIKITTLLAAVLAASFSMAGLGVGDKAPALKVAKWSKGNPVKSFETGKIYVVEFWATWCGPCKQSIPHLTDLAKKFKGKVTFTGVSVWETDPKNPDKTYVAKVDKFVKDMGAKMDYNVAVDGLEGTMAKTWMEAANQNGIPTAFVIDGTGSIAWIGHPMAELEEVLDQVVAGKYDVAAAKQKAAEAAAKQAEMEKQQAAIQKDMGDVMQLLQGGKKGDALTKLDEVIGKYPMFKQGLIPLRFNLALEVNEADAYKYAKTMGESEWKDDAQMLNQVAWTIVEGKAQGVDGKDFALKAPDYDVAIALSQRGADITKDTEVLKPMVLDTLAFAHWKKGNKAKALEIQTRAIELLNTVKGVPEDSVKDMKERLELFKKG